MSYHEEYLVRRMFTMVQLQILQLVRVHSFYKGVASPKCPLRVCLSPPLLSCCVLPSPGVLLPLLSLLPPAPCLFFSAHHSMGWSYTLEKVHVIGAYLQQDILPPLPCPGVLLLLLPLPPLPPQASAATPYMSPPLLRMEMASFNTSG